MKLLILSVLLTTTVAAPAAQSLTFHDDGSYRFYYETGKEGGSHSRSEIRQPDGVVIGKFSYQDPDGDIREVNYRADQAGFVAEGDVSVQGAPKGQFPVSQADHQKPVAEQPIVSSTSEVDTNEQQPAEQHNTGDNQQQSQQQSESLVVSAKRSFFPYEEEEGDNKQDDMQDLALEESAPNDPPEAFPPGFFLQKFHGLRRLPEPTKEPTTTTEASKEGDEANQAQPEKPDETKEEEKEVDKPAVVPAAPSGAHAPMDGSVFSFAPIKPPFPVPAAVPVPPSHHQEWASAMFHQPVYVFSYHQPDSYGYHYYY